MHEYRITQRIIEIAEQQAKQSDSELVTQVTLVVGDNSGLVADSIVLYFDIIAKGSMCESAALIIKRIKPKLKCKKCGVLFERKPFSFSCISDGCDGEGEPTEIGNEFYVESIEVS